jgi:sirohydrochlorin cobaltochelatase
MPVAIERALEQSYASGFRCIGQILIEKSASGSFILCHRDDAQRRDLTISRIADDAAKIAKFDDAKNYRPLKTAPNLCHGWRLELADVVEMNHALNLFYPGRLAMFFAFEEKTLQTTPLRETLNRQSGMYRVAARITDAEIDLVVANFCRSNGGCLRTILWKRDVNGAPASTKLPPEKFDPVYDQAAGPRSTTAATTSRCIPLLCQEACNLLVAEARKVVKGER